MSRTSTGVRLLVLLSAFSAAAACQLPAHTGTGRRKRIRYPARIDPQSARGRLCAAHDRQPRSSGRTACSHRGTTRSRGACAGRCTATARAGWSPWPVMAPGPAAALRYASRITYRFTGSPATRISGEKMIASGHTAREIAARVTGPCLPHSARVRPRRSLARKMAVDPGRDLAHFRVSDGCWFSGTPSSVPVERT